MAYCVNINVFPFCIADQPMHWSQWECTGKCNAIHSAGQLRSPFLKWDSDLHLIYNSLDPHQTSSLSLHMFLHKLRQKFPIRYDGLNYIILYVPQNCSFPTIHREILTLVQLAFPCAHPTHYSQTASWSNQPFLQINGCDRQIDRRTPRYKLCWRRCDAANNTTQDEIVARRASLSVLICLARPANRPTGLHILLALISFFIFFKWSQIISG